MLSSTTFEEKLLPLTKASKPRAIVLPLLDHNGLSMAASCMINNKFRHTARTWSSLKPLSQTLLYQGQADLFSHALNLVREVPLQ